MHDFNISAEDCGLAHLRSSGSDMQALTHHIAMSVVHSRQRRTDEQQRRNAIQLAGFGSSPTRTSRKRAREDEDAYYISPTSPSHEESSFYQATQFPQQQYITLDDDSVMAAPVASETTPEEFVKAVMGGTLGDFDQLLPFTEDGDDHHGSTEDDTLAPST